MNRALRLTALVWLFALIGAGAALAQDDPLRIRGVVIGSEGDPWPGVTIRLEIQGRPVQVRVSDDQGEFLFETAPVGPYRLIVQAAGLATFTHSDDLQRPADLVIRLRPDGQWEIRDEPIPQTAPAPEPRGGEGPDPGYAEIEVFYGTDRALRRNRPVEERFGPDRMTWLGRPHLGVCRVSVPRDHRMGEIERPSIWKLELSPDPSKHMVLLGLEAMSQDTFYRRLRSHLDSSGAREMMVFVHGYNVSFHDAALRTAQLAYDLGIDGAPVLYSWPSRASLAAYTHDEATVDWTAPHLEGFLRNLSDRSGASSIYLIAHSMGNRALTRALERIALRMGNGSRPPFTEILLTAPDIDAQVFTELAQDFRRAAERVTLYASSNDRALKASKGVHGIRRAGDSDPEVLVVDGIDTIDVSAVDTSLLGHSYVGDNCSVISDMNRLLRKREPADRRSNLSKKEKAAGRFYWTFSGASSCLLPAGP